MWRSELAGGDGSAERAAPDAGAADSDDPGPSDCGKPWYKCEATCRDIILRGGGRAFGECSGDCHFELEVRPAYDLEHSSCFAVHVTLVVGNSHGSERTIRARLTDASWERLALISRSLSAVRLKGCPDCDDGGEAWITLKADDATDQAVHYAFQAPVPGAVDADAFVQALIDQLLACSGDRIEQCTAT